MNRDNGIAGVVLTRKKSFGFKLVDQIAEGADFAAKIGVDVFTFLREIEIGGNVVGAAREIGVSGQYVLEAFFLAHHLLRALRIRPQIRVGCLFVDFD
jgi:hypothetical protein